MIKFKFILIFLFLLSACGYTPIYKGLSDVDFEIELINLSGDRYINNRIKNDISRYKNNNNSSKTLYKINIQSDYEKTSISKNLTGEDSTYELKVITIVDISSEKFNDKIVITEKFNMNKISDEFEEKEYEDTIKGNFANSISRKLITRISQL